MPSDNHAKTFTLAAMSLGFGIVQLDVTIVNVAVVDIGRSFAGDIAAIQWVVSAYTIAFASLILSAGVLGDRVGARRVFCGGFAIFTLASLACGLAPTLAVLIAGRVAQGLGAAILVPNSLALLNHAYPDDGARARAVAIWAAGASAALTAGPLVGGILVAAVAWRAIFFVNVPIAVFALWLTGRFAGETPLAPAHRLDPAGQITAIVALGCLAGATIETGTRGWTDPLVLAGFAGFLAAFGLFLVVETRVEKPMLPLSLFRNITFRTMAAAGLLVNVAFYGLIFVFSLYFQRVAKLDVFWTGVEFLPLLGAVLPANLLAPGLAEIINPNRTIIAGAILCTLACASLILVAGAANPFAYVAPFVALGAGLGLIVPPLTSSLLGSVDKARSGLASGVLNAMRQIGSVIGVALFGSFVARDDAIANGLRLSLFVSAFLFAMTAVALAIIARSGEPAAGTSVPR